MTGVDAILGAMKWIVGTNLREDSAGAFEFLGWLHGQTRGTQTHAAVALAVIREAGDAPGGRSMLVSRVEASARDFVSRSPARDMIQNVRVEVSPSVAETLSNVARDDGATLVLGRAAPMENQSLVRLGTVARRTLRRLEGPVVIVPPDWSAATAGPGPVLVAIDATAPSLAAIAFAQAFATSVDRPLIAVSALRGAGGLGTALLSPPEFAALRERHEQQEGERLSSFLEEHGLDALSVRSKIGPTVATVVDVATELGAAAVIAGSRRLTLAERIFSASVGTELASFAPIPVAVVPPDFGSLQG